MYCIEEIILILHFINICLLIAINNTYLIHNNILSWAGVVLMRVHRLRRWPNITSTLAHCLVLVGIPWGPWGGGGDGVDRKSAWICSWLGSHHVFSHLLMWHVATTTSHPANMRHWTNVDLMLAHCLRLWANIKSTLVQRVTKYTVIRLLFVIFIIDYLYW